VCEEEYEEEYEEAFAVDFFLIIMNKSINTDKQAQKSVSQSKT
jgi:hypothetical protein